MEMEDIRKFLLTDAYQVCPGLDELRGKPIAVDDMLDFIIYEDGIKKAYDNHAERKSIQRHLLDSGHSDELIGKDMEEIAARLEGHEINAMQFYELNNIIDRPLLKKIGGKQICSSKRVSNSQFVDYMDDYDNEINRLHDSMNTPEEILFNTQAFFTFEWKYAADIVYDIVLAAEERGFPNFDAQKAVFILGTVTIPPVQPVPYTITAECRMVNARRKLAPMLFENDMNVFSDYFFSSQAMFRLRYLLKMVQRGKSLAELVYETPLEDRVQFLKDHFWIWDKHTRVKEWTPNRIKYAREIYQEIVMAIPEPSIK